jgi:hypothetical protein
MKLISSVLLCSILTAISVSAFADQPAPQGSGERARPQLTETRAVGPVGRYIVTPMGHVGGFVLANGTVVRLRPSEGDKMAAQVAVGETVTVDGRTAGNGRPIMRATVSGPHGQVVEPTTGGNASWKGLDHEQKVERRKELRAERAAALAKLPATSLDGTVQTVLTGRHGAPRALLLSNGGTIFLEGSLRHAMAGASIKAGDVVRASGKGGTYKNGASVEASQVTLANGTQFSGRPL